MSLPDGPGSVGGLGDDVQLGGNMGLMSHRVSFAVPAGFAGVTPELGLSYSSGGGSSVVGMGWGMAWPSIERLTRRGLPDYDTEDEFAGASGEELVRIPGTSPPIYRARFEGAFTRYTWHDAGAHGYWTAEYADGRVGYFGATSDGTPVEEARVGGPNGTFRYRLVSLVDPYGHHQDTIYAMFGNASLPLQVAWVHDADGTPYYAATYQYEERPDPITDATMGFVERLEHRLTTVTIFAGDTMIRRYELAYESADESGGLSRLSHVTMYGADGTAHPGDHHFHYAKALGPDCVSDDCVRPTVVGLGSLGLDLKAGNTTLADLNGDGLPDVIDTSEEGPHRLFFGAMSDGFHVLEGPSWSQVGTQGAFDLSTAAVQALDIDGDGRTDLMNVQQGTALMNEGAGDWAATVVSLWDGDDGGGLPGELELGEGELQTVRFMDYDGDKRIDVIRSLGDGAANVTEVFRNTGVGQFVQDESVAPLGASFSSGRLELNDVNGDGLLDAIEVLTDLVRYKLHLGRGQWEPAEPTAWYELSGFEFSEAEAVAAELEDLNGDGLADLVLVSGDTIRYWRNRSGLGFDPERQIDSGDVDGTIPQTDANMSVLYADMNGNGSRDVVWVTASGEVTYLDLYPERPHLLVRTETGLGQVREVTYTSSVAERLASPAPWTHPLPMPMTVVKSLSESDALTGVVSMTEQHYRSGFYDGDEKVFRGYEVVTRVSLGDESAEDATIVEHYDVGATDPWRAGRLLRTESWSGDRLIEWAESTFEDCPVAGVPAEGDPDYASLTWPVRSVCEVATTTGSVEGTDEPQHVTTATETRYDGYGSPVWVASYGVVSVGGAGCDACSAEGPGGHPCGASCQGDERYVATEYVMPETNDDRWLLGLPTRRRIYGEADASGEPATSLTTEQRVYYDGPSFEGLAYGRATAGDVSRTEVRVSAGTDLVVDERAAFDSHGNQVELYRPSGDPATGVGRRTWGMNDLGLRSVIAEAEVAGDSGSYVLRREFEFHPLWMEATSSTPWRIVGEDATEAGDATHFEYDAFGRIAAVIRPGATSSAPSETFTYELDSPLSRIVHQRRSSVSGAMDQRQIVCIDPLGRIYQERAQVTPGTYQVSGFTQYNGQGTAWKTWGPYSATSEACDTAPPEDGTPDIGFYDGLGRPTAQVLAPVEGEVESPVHVTTYLPLATVVHDAEDTRVGGPHADTPTTTRTNGLGATLSIERLLEPDGAPLVHRFEYDGLGRLVRAVDPGGAVRVQTLDLLGRAVSIYDENRGLVTFEYDEDGNRTHQTSDDGVVIREAYDALQRIVARWGEADPEATMTRYEWDRPDGCAATQCSNVPGHIAKVTYALGDGTFGTDEFGYARTRDMTFARRTLHGHAFEAWTLIDHAGRPTTEIYPSGLTVTRSFDGLGRVTTVDGYLDDIRYADNGSVSQVTFAGGAVQRWELDERERVRRVTVDAGGARRLDVSLTRDALGNLLSVTDDAITPGTPSREAAYEYDALYRLTGATLDGSQPDLTEVLTYSLDDAMRLTSKVSSLGAASPAHVGEYTYGVGAGPQAVTSAGGHTLAYSAVGRLVSRDDTSFEYDHRGYLIRASRAGETVARYGYSDGGERVFAEHDGRMSYYVMDGFEVRDFTAIAWITLGRSRLVRISDPGYAAELLSDLAPAGGSDSALVPAPDHAIGAGDAWLAQAVTVGALTLAAPQPPSEVTHLLDAANAAALSTVGGETTYQHPDHRGNTALVTDPSGDVERATIYHPYGTVRWGDEPEYGFSGKERDAATGLVYYGGRYLDPTLGRWVTPDARYQLLDEESLSFFDDASAVYGFNLGDPVNMRDDTGEFANLVLGAIIGASVKLVEQVVIYRATGQKLTVAGAMSIAGSVIWAGVAGGMTGGLSAFGPALSALWTAAKALYGRARGSASGTTQAARVHNAYQSSIFYRTIGSLVAQGIAIATGDYLTVAMDTGVTVATGIVNYFSYKRTAAGAGQFSLWAVGLAVWSVLPIIGAEITMGLRKVKRAWTDHRAQRALNRRQATRGQPKTKLQLTRRELRARQTADWNLRESARARRQGALQAIKFRWKRGGKAHAMGMGVLGVKPPPKPAVK